MAERNARLNVTTEGGATVVEMNDRKILDEIFITQIGEEFEAILARSDDPKLVVDFANVSHMSSSALGMLITLHKRVREKNGQLRLCNIQSQIFEVFRITRLDEIFSIHDSRAEALQSLS